MDKKLAKLTLRHSNRGRGTFCYCNRLKLNVLLKFNNSNLWLISSSGCLFRKNGLMCQFNVQFVFSPWWKEVCNNLHCLQAKIRFYITYKIAFSYCYTWQQYPLHNILLYIFEFTQFRFKWLSFNGYVTSYKACRHIILL